MLSEERKFFKYYRKVLYMTLYIIIICIAYFIEILLHMNTKKKLQKLKNELILLKEKYGEE